MTNKKRFLMLIGLPVLVAISTACEAAEPDQKNIQGRVWSDTDADGIQDEHEEGLERITVRVVNDDPDDPRSSRTETIADGTYNFDILLAQGHLWTVIVELPNDIVKFTIPNMGEEHKDSDVNLDGKARHEGWNIDAGILSEEVIKRLTPIPPSSPTPTTMPTTPPTLTPTAIPTTMADEAPTVTEESGEEPLGGESEQGHAYDCKSGAKVDPGLLSGTRYEISAQPNGMTMSGTFLEILSDLPFYWGVDWAGPGKSTMPPDPNLILAAGTHGGASSGVLNGALAGIRASQAGPSNEALILSAVGAVTGAPAGTGYLVSLTISEKDVPSGMTHLRLTFSDGDICLISGDLAENNGFRPVEEFGADVAEFVAAANGTRNCDAASSTCLMLSDDFTWERTGDQTLKLTMDGKVYAVQFNPLEGTAESRQAEFVEVGWELQELTTHQTDLRTWQIFELHANGQLHGLLAVSDNGSSENPVAFAISIIGEGPLSEAELASLTERITALVEGFRSAYELVE